MSLSPDQFGEGLTDKHREVLAFEKEHANSGPGRKDSAIFGTFKQSSTVYHQQLNALLDNPHALAHDPVLVNRLRAKRQKARDARANREPGTWGGSRGGR